jgi:hypothetical protein
VYLAVDYEAGLIKLAENRQNALTPSPTKFSSASAHCESRKLSAGTIAAIVLGVILGLALLIGAAIYLRRRHRRQQSQREKVVQHNSSQPEHRTSITEYSPIIEEPLSPELPGGGMTHELPSPDSSHSPRPLRV